MIHIATVHYKTDKWIDIQSRYIKKYITEPYRIYAVLNGIEKRFFDRFYFVAEVEYPNLGASASHAEKLNYLAAKIVSQANDEDILIFMDGDAFPINENVLSFIKEKIKNHKLAAIRRDETRTDFQAHASFCATTVGFWKHINGDWRLGYQWEDVMGGKVTDVGGKLLKKLIEHKVDWFAMLRSNKKNLHPLWFGIYSDVIYHHGGGFREAMCQLDRKTSPLMYIEKLMNYKKYSRFLTGRIIPFIGRAIKKAWLYERSIFKDRIYNEIRKNEKFYLIFSEKE